MRKLIWLIVLTGATARVHAQPKPAPGAIDDDDWSKSALVAELARKLDKGDKTAAASFWQAVAERGTPLVEPLADSPRHRLLTFVYRSDTVKSVAIFGLPEPLAYLERLPRSDVWVRSYRVRDDARFTYSLGADVPPGVYDLRAVGPLLRADPLNKHRVSPVQSFCVLPNAPAQPLTVAAPDVPAGEVHVFKAASKRLGNERRIYVYTPPGYDPHGGPYPLVVMFDGDGYLTDIPAPTILDNLIAHKRIPPTIALFIDQLDRGRELGLGEPFADAVALELVPWVQARYHASADPRAVVVGGLSLGGLEASFAAFRHPDVLGNVLSQSGSYWWFNDGDDPETLTRMYVAAPKKPIRFYLEVGLFEGGRPGLPTMLGANRHLRDVLNAKGYAVTLTPFAGGHDPRSWRGTFGDALASLIAGAHPRRAAPKQPGADLVVKESGQSLIAAVMRAASGGGAAALRTFKQLRDDKAYDADEGMVNQLGYQLLYAIGDAHAAVGVFEDNVARFPKSWNAYDSLGEALRAAGERARAVEAYKQSLALNPKNQNAAAMLKELGAPTH